MEEMKLLRSWTQSGLSHVMPVVICISQCMQITSYDVINEGLMEALVVELVH